MKCFLYLKLFFNESIKKNKIPALTQVSNLKYSLFHEVFLVEVFSTTDLREKIK